MSLPRPPRPAKLIAGFFLKDKRLAEGVVRDLQECLGPVEMISASQV